MIRRLTFAALLALLPGVAAAQIAFIAPTPTNPADSSDRIATTAWVNTWSPPGNFVITGNLTVGGVIIDGQGQLLTNIVAPATPAAGTTRVYVDSTTKTLTAKNDAGTVSNTVVASTAVANQFMTGISAAGVITRAQPNFTDLAGSASCAQEPARTGGVTAPAGSCVQTVVTNANLTGDVTSVGNATTLTNAPVIAKVLTGYVSGAGTVSSSDSILSAIQKLNGNDAVRISTVKKQVFTASGTYTPSAGMVYAIVECVGGGGGGGGTATTAASNYAAGGGGGGGAYSKVTLTAAQIGASQTVTIGTAGAAGASGNNAGGAGGTTSLGTLCVAAAGGGGAGNSGSSLPIGGTGGSAASGTGDVRLSGSQGQAGVTSGSSSGTSFVFIPSGAGGSSGLGYGAGAAGLLVSTSTTGTAGTLYGGGGSGAATSNATGAAAGGAGATGLVYVQEFNTQ
jgi:hypothetical protein